MSKLKTRVGFSMIELIAVMLIISVLGSIALPQFIDLRREAKAAALRNILSTLRMAIKNHTQQAMLRCGAQTSGGNFYTRNGQQFYQVMALALRANSVLYNAGTGLELCNASQLPNTASSIIYQANGATAKFYVSGVEAPGGGSIPANPLFVVSAASSAYDMLLANTAGVNSYGGRCAMVDYLISIDLQTQYVYINDTGEIFPGTRTTGIDECSF